MVRFINKFTGSDMWVAEDRVEEYKEAGHRLAVDNPKPAVPIKKKKGKKSNE